MAKILITVHKFWPSVGGLQRLSYNLAKRLVQRGHSVTVCTSHSEDRPALEYVEGILVKRFRRIWMGPWWPDATMPGMAKSLLESRYDIIHSFDLWNFHSLLASTLTSVSRTPFVLNSILHPTYSLYKETFGKLICRSADAVVVQCQQERQNIIGYANLNKVFVVPCGIDSNLFSRLRDDQTFRRKYRMEPDDKLVIYVGSVSGNKSALDLVNLMPKVVNMVDRARLIMVARGSNLDRLRQHAAIKGVSDRVTVLGKVDEEDLLQAYATADLFAFPSKNESFGIVLVEAAAAGLPIVSTKVGIAPEIVNEGLTGYTCDRCDSSFADRMIEVLSRDEFRTNAKLLRLEILKRFDWESVTDSLEKVYSEVLRRSPDVASPSNNGSRRDGRCL